MFHKVYFLSVIPPEKVQKPAENPNIPILGYCQYSAGKIKPLLL